MAHKYHAKATEVDGHRFASKAEAQRWGELRLLLRDGQITALRLQPRFILQEAFARDGVKVRAVTYVADFEYFENGKRVVEDVKGMEVEPFPTKWRLFLKRYPDIDARIVKA
uniref:DUF1064 domain-containing protein n=1 Tax=viral metagenome TaxID=1070528 RepID=A0A6H1ZZJ4_9ZZZZ